MHFSFSIPYCTWRGFFCLFLRIYRTIEPVEYRHQQLLSVTGITHEPYPNVTIDVPTCL